MRVRKAYAERRKRGPTASISPSNCKLLPTASTPSHLALQALGESLGHATGGTRSETSPPKVAISLTPVEERKL